jgi:hypothetical protein
VVRKQKTFEHPGHLVQAQRALVTVQAEHRACLAALPSWGGGYWATLSGEGRVVARGRFQHAADEPAVEAM